MWLRFVFLAVCVIKRTNSDAQCVSSQDCLCSTVQATYEYQCSFDDPKIVVQVNPDSIVDVQCITQIDWETQNLPPVNIYSNTAKSLSFRMCPAPARFIDVIRLLNLTTTKSLKFDYSPDFYNVTAEYFQGLEGHLEQVILNDNDVREIDEDAFAGLVNLVEIDLRGNNLTLKPNVFNWSKRLKLLDLAQNNLDVLPPGLFNELTNLAVLYLWSNRLKSLDANLFANLNKLRSLELSTNELNNLPSNVFAPLVNLRTISLMKNRLETLPPGLFANNPLLETVKINMNPRLNQLPSGLFTNLTKLGTVLLGDCGLVTLSGDLFAGATALQNVSLQKNRLEYLPVDLFANLSQLQNLDLSGNKIGELHERVFFDNINLVVLNLENNLLTGLGNSLYNLQRLQSINLNRNRIVTIKLESFQRTEKLLEILLADNYLELSRTDLKLGLSPFNSNVKLEKLDLSRNRLVTISDDWIYAKVALKELDLSHNNITELDINKLITPSQKLNIDLRFNSISTVNFYDAERFAKHQDNLDAYTITNAGNTIVNLNNNPLICDCLIYDFARYMERSIDPTVPTLVTVLADELTCAGPHDFLGYPVPNLHSNMLSCSLQQLLANATCPEGCTCSFRPWDKSLVYDCAMRDLRQPPSLFLPEENIYNQTEVRLYGNRLTSAPQGGMGYENVTKLQLSHNNIGEVLWIPPKIQVLELDNNNISGIQHEVLTKLNASSSHLANITLGKNPWNCDCSIMNLTSFLVSHLTNKQIDAKDIKCSQTGKLLVHLSTTEICPAFTNLVIVSSVALAFLAVVAALMTVVYYHYEQEIKVWLFAHNMCLWFVTEDELDKDKAYDAFVSYSHKDEDFLINELLPVLEQGPQPYKICIHVRDWIAGEFIPKQIVRSVEDSRRTIVILSKGFLKSVWGKIEFRTAHTQAMSEGRARVILVIYGEVDLENDLDEELKAYIKSNTYVKWGDPWFWDKLRYALPHSKVARKRSQKNQNIMISLNDKLDLIGGVAGTPNPGSTPPAIVGLDPLLLKANPLDFTGASPLVTKVN